MAEQIVLTGSYGDLTKRFQCISGGELMLTRTEDGHTRAALHADKIGVVAFGWLHFKDCCAEFGMDWRQAVHLDRSSRMTEVDAVIFHHTSTDPRMRQLMDKLHVAGWTL